MNESSEKIRKRLFALQDLSYRKFQGRLMPTVNPDAIIGVRVPELRRLARQLGREPEMAAAFLADLPHQYYDENNLHGRLICAYKSYEETVAALDIFLPCVDNWATCDMLSPAAFKCRPPGLLDQARIWMASAHPYTIRFGISVLMNYYMDAGFQAEQMDWVAELQSDEYYVNMAVAWYFATALTGHYEEALPYILQKRLGSWVHNTAIQKALDSHQISRERKARLRSLRIRSAREKKV